MIKPSDGKVVGKLVSSNIANGRVCWKVTWKCFLSHKIIDALWPNDHTPQNFFQKNPKAQCPEMLALQHNLMAHQEKFKKQSKYPQYGKSSTNYKMPSKRNILEPFKMTIARVT